MCLVVIAKLMVLKSFEAAKRIAVNFAVRCL